MKTIFFGIKNYELEWIKRINREEIPLETTDKLLSVETADLCNGFDMICVSTVDDVSESVLNELKKKGVKHVCIRATGFDNIDIDAADKMGILVYNVPDYGPIAIAEHSLLLMLALLRNMKQSIHQLPLSDFRIDNLIGEELSGKTIGILGTGKIGKSLAKILQGFSSEIIAYDLNEDYEWAQEYNVKYVKLEELCMLSDILSIHIPLNKESYHLLNRSLFKIMKNHLILINTARGGIIDTDMLLECLVNQKIGGAGLDVYEFEKGIFFYDYRKIQLRDDRLRKLLDLKNVIITPHQAFATQKAIQKIFESTIYNITCAGKGTSSKNLIKLNKAILTNA